MLKARGYYNFQAGEATINLRFCTWSMMRFCEKENDMTLQELLEAVSKTLKLRQFAMMLLCAAEAYAVEKKEPFNYTLDDAAFWIDDLGGINGKGVQDAISVMIGSMTSSKSDEEKKAKSR